MPRALSGQVGASQQVMLVWTICWTVIYFWGTPSLASFDLPGLTVGDSYAIQIIAVGDTRAAVNGTAFFCPIVLLLGCHESHEGLGPDAHGRGAAVGDGRCAIEVVDFGEEEQLGSGIPGDQVV